MPTTTWTSDQYILDLASETTVTITWTGDTNARDCQYDSSVSIMTGGTVYTSFDTLNHVEETFSYTNPTYTVSTDAQTTIIADTNNLGTYDVIYTMTDSVDTSLTRTYTLTLIVINDVCTPDVDI